MDEVAETTEQVAALDPIALDAIDRLRARADPARFRQRVRDHQAELLQEIERLLLQYDLAVSDPHLPAGERRMVVGQLERTLASLEWRLNETEAVLAEFELGEKKGMNRSMRREMGRQARRR